jgi:hypothetical protein
MSVSGKSLSFAALAVCVAAVVIGAVVSRQPRRTSPAPPAQANSAENDVKVPPDGAETRLTESDGPTQTPAAPAEVRASVPGFAKASVPVPPDVPTLSPEQLRELMGKMAVIDTNHAAFTVPEATVLREQFAVLKKQGAAAVPAIREFLARNQDLSFDAPEIANAAGFSSLRMGFLKTLQEIGGEEATQLAADTLKSTGDPLEIATLAGMLEKNAPGEHRDEAVKAARDAVALAVSGQLPGQRIAPAFEVLQTYGDTNVIPFLQEQSGTRWRQNAVLALAELPDGAGVPTLLDLAKEPAVANLGRGDLVLRPLAQVAVRYPQALDALAQFAQENAIPDKAWPTIISALAGNDYISNGHLLPDTRPPSTDLNALAAQRIAMLDRLAAATSSETAGRLIQAARANLAQRKTKG